MCDTRYIKGNILVLRRTKFFATVLQQRRIRGATIEKIRRNKMTTTRTIVVLLVLVAFAHVEAAPKKKKGAEKTMTAMEISTTESTDQSKAVSSKKSWKTDETASSETEVEDISDMLKGLFEKPLLKKGVLLTMLVKLISLIGVPMVHRVIAIYQEQLSGLHNFQPYSPYSENDYFGYGEPASVPAAPQHYYPSKLIGSGGVYKRLAIVKFVSELAKRALGYHQAYHGM